MSFTPYHANYFAHELTKRSPSNSVQKLTTSLLDAQVDLNPHQVDAALFAFRSPLSKGAILADEVGLGKTIEAGLVISQKWAERKRHILIIAPANLRKQWSQEMQDKFHLPSFILEKDSFTLELRRKNKNPFEQEWLVICSYEFARKYERYITLVDWDLVVIDEAHRLRNVYKSSNKIAKAIKSAVEEAPKLLLTATPLQNSLLELYGLVSIIDEHAFGDLKSFKAQYSRSGNEDASDLFNELRQRLRPLCQRTLRRQVLEYIKFTDRKAIVEPFYPTDEEQELYEGVSAYLQRPALYALPPSQRQLMTLIMRKLLASSTHAVSGTLDALIRKLDAVIAQHRPNRQFSLEIAEDFETYDTVSDEWTDEPDSEEADKRTYTELEIGEIREEISQLKRFLTLAKSIRKDSKGAKLCTALSKGFEEGARLGAPTKAIIFTESTRTQRYLLELLEEQGFANQVVLFNGSNNDARSKAIYRRWLMRHQGTERVTGSPTVDMRAALVDYFREEATIFLATEAAAEGINLQFCSLIVNYDLPWNPQRIEQRIGRCHRYGQKHSVVVVNFLNKKNAADERVYELLNEKFKLFDGVFGASDEILGSIESGLDFEKRIAQIYQQCKTPEEIQASFDQLQAELESQINSALQQTKRKLLENFDEEVHEKLRVSLRESSQFVSRYEGWLWNLTRYGLEGYADFEPNSYAFRLNESPFADLLVPTGLYRIDKNPQDAYAYRIGHPLAQRLIADCKQSRLPRCEMVFNYTRTGKKISMLEPLVGQSGWLQVQQLTIDSFEPEDHLLLAGITNNEVMLDTEQCTRLFSLQAITVPFAGEPHDEVTGYFTQQTASQQAVLLLKNEERNNTFFDEELGKLEHWAEDVKRSLELELRNLDVEIKTLKAEARKTPKLTDKLALQRDIKEKEKRRNTLRRDLFQQQDEIEDKKEKLIADIECRLQQGVELKTLFLVKFRII